MNARFALVVCAALAVPSAACGPAPADRPAMVQVTAASSPQVLLASREVGASEVSAALVADFDQVLTALEIRCTESRASTPGLPDIAINVVSTAKKNGRDIGHLEVLRALEGSIHEGADMKIDCTDAARRLFDQ